MGQGTRQMVVLGCAVLLLTALASDASGFRLESYAFCPGNFSGFYADACSYQPAESLQFGVQQHVENNYENGHAWVTSAIDTTDRGLTVNGACEDWIAYPGCTSLNAVDARLYGSFSGCACFRVVVRQEGGDPPFCTLAFAAGGSGQNGYCPCNFCWGYTQVQLLVNEDAIMSGTCWVVSEGDVSCAWDSTGVVRVADGDVVQCRMLAMATTSCSETDPVRANISMSVELLDDPTASVEGGDGSEARPICVHQNTPNPFSKDTSISFDLSRPEHVRLAVYTAEGKQVSVIADEVRPAGRNTVIWPGTDDERHEMPSGIYFCRLEAGSASETIKMLVVE